jgi:hypothetical protein
MDHKQVVHWYARQYSSTVLSLQFTAANAPSLPDESPNAQKQWSGTASYANRQTTATSIPEGAKALLIEQDFTSLGKRGLARALDRSPGSLQEFEKLRPRAAGPTSNPLRSVLAFVYNLVLVIRSTTKQPLMHSDAHLAV